MGPKSQEIDALFYFGNLSQISPKTVFPQFCKQTRVLPMQNTYRVFPDVIYASVILSIELIFSEESLFFLIFNASMKGRQKYYLSFINLNSQIDAMLN